ncbi:MAG: MBL fold metallo-hydrolase [Deltaproteobacteria bacterium]|jgi:metallo-beta-lactamase family protein|nr:MBL fold metallo-hydrolase [Deltaproteobacteria bacterium]
MKIKCLGAVRTVTGSCYQLENPGGGLTLLDCGLFQGGRQTELRNFNTPVYRPEALSGIVVTHAHMDHSGLVPRLVKAGFRGPVYATGATADLLGILWADGAHIQELESKWKTRKNKRQGGAYVAPLYTAEDARAATDLLEPVGYGRDIELRGGLGARFFQAGHILGAASVQMASPENGGETRVLFSGDLGRKGQLLIPDPEEPPRSDAVFMETTYGNRLHKGLDESIDEFFGVVDEAVKLGAGRILIPAFAVERTQEILYLLAKAHFDGRIPKDLPIFLDSPLAAGASEIYLRHPELYDEEAAAVNALRQGPQHMPCLKVTKTAEESQRINDVKGPAIVIAGSGMANAGRILHHLKHNLWRADCHVIFVGFQAQGTTGRRLVEGADEVKIFREPVKVKAKIHTIGGFSGHADQSELTEWLRPQVHENLTVTLVHGEEQGMLAYQDHLAEVFPGLKTVVPHWLEVLDVTSKRATLQPSSPEAGIAAVAAPSRDYSASAEAESMFRRLDRLKENFGRRQEAFPPNSLANLEALLNMAEEIILR